MCYFPVDSVKAVKIYFLGSCPVNILIQTHDRAAFMALANTPVLYYSKMYFWQKKRYPWKLLDKIQFGHKPQLGKNNNR